MFTGMTIALTLMQMLTAGPVAPDPGFKLGVGSAGGLFAPTRFEHSHGVQLSLVSGGGRTIQQSILLNSFSFKLHEAVDLRVHLDLAQTTPMAGLEGMGSNGTVLPGVELDYRPTENLHIHFDWATRQRSPYYRSYDPFFGGEDGFYRWR